MNENTRHITLFIKIACILYVIRILLSLAVELFPRPFLSLMGVDSARFIKLNSPLYSILPLLCAAAIFFVCCQLVNSAVTANTAERARFALTVTLAVLVISPITNVVGQAIITRVVYACHGASVIAAYQYLRTVEGYISLISSISYPLLTAAAAMNWQRHLTDNRYAE